MPTTVCGYGLRDFEDNHVQFHAHDTKKGAHKACGSVYAIVGFSTVSRAGTLSDRIYAYGREKSLTLFVVTYSNS